MNFTKQTGMKWAKAAGNQIRAIFATGRVPRDYKSSQPTELEVDDVHSLSQSMRRPQTKEAQFRQCRSALGFLPASCASDRDVLTVDQKQRRGQNSLMSCGSTVAKQDVRRPLRQKDARGSGIALECMCMYTLLRRAVIGCALLLKHEIFDRCQISAPKDASWLRSQARPCLAHSIIAYAQCICPCITAGGH